MANPSRSENSQAQNGAQQDTNDFEMTEEPHDYPGVCALPQPQHTMTLPFRPAPDTEMPEPTPIYGLASATVASAATSHQARRAAPFTVPLASQESTKAMQDGLPTSIGSDSQNDQHSGVDHGTNKAVPSRSPLPSTRKSAAARSQELRKQLEERDRELIKKDCEIADKDREIAGMRRKIARLEREKAESERAIERLWDEILAERRDLLRTRRRIVGPH